MNIFKRASYFADLIIKQSFAGQLTYLNKYKPTVEKAIKELKTPEKVYVELIVNNPYNYNEILKILQELDSEKKLEYDFIKKIEEIRKEYSTKKNLIEKIDNFEIYDMYTPGDKDHYENLREAQKVIREAVDLLKQKGYELVIYGKMYLKNPTTKRAIAEYDFVNDYITLRLYKGSNFDHIMKSLIHELAHRIWHVLMTNRDHDWWETEYWTKLHKDQPTKSKDLSFGYGAALSFVGIKKEGFPSSYSQTNPSEYFAECVTNYIVDDEKYSVLLDEIF